MKHYLPLFIAVLTVSCGSEGASDRNKNTNGSQPISVSMAECAAIFKVTATTAEEKGKSAQKVSEMRRGADAFLSAAHAQAETEGASNVSRYVADAHAEKLAKWEERWLGGSDVAFIMDVSENLEWVQYCAKMGKSYGVLPLP